jgi:hypothetical protein
MDIAAVNETQVQADGVLSLRNDGSVPRYVNVTRDRIKREKFECSPCLEPCGIPLFLLFGWLGLVVLCAGCFVTLYLRD